MSFRIMIPVLLHRIVFADITLSRYHYIALAWTVAEWESLDCRSLSLQGIPTGFSRKIHKNFR